MLLVRTGSSAFRGMNNHFVRLSSLEPDTAYYFVIEDSEGVSERYWVRTGPADRSDFSYGHRR